MIGGLEAISHQISKSVFFAIKCCMRLEQRFLSEFAF